MTDRPFDPKHVTVVGAGLAGSECALQMADRGYQVTLIEMRAVKQTPAHKTTNCAELVCSNSFGSMSEGSAPHQLKWEAEQLNSQILQAAKVAAVPAGQALGVDRELFAQIVNDKVQAHPRIKLENKIVESLDDIPRPAVIATGPLTDEALAESLRRHFGDEFCYFFDAIAPIIDTDSINTEIAWKQDRYDKGTPDYFNCGLNKDQYFALINEIAGARKIEPKHFETTKFFEGCMPIEVMVERGPHTLRFGPMKPVGLRAPNAERDPYAVVQLRQDNKEGTAYNMVGFQTRMAYAEQVRVFRMIPGLENAEFLKLGSIHRNLYINSPKRLNRDLSSQNDSWLFFAGQITGVEGYFESTCMGLLVAQFLDRKIQGLEFAPPPRASAMGSVLEAITDPLRAKHFQPTNMNFGLLPPLEEQIRDKSAKKLKQIELARASFTDWKNATHSLNGLFGEFIERPNFIQQNEFVTSGD
ncbi:MAG: methylenetetrahydrofolate--tRNA-(uracil(54)-C(5))-methyltransferase (FADH(2)-oxidizing) TrmFO [Bdellovibrio sp.]